MAATVQGEDDDAWLYGGRKLWFRLYRLHFYGEKIFDMSGNFLPIFNSNNARFICKKSWSMCRLWGTCFSKNHTQSQPVSDTGVIMTRTHRQTAIVQSDSSVSSDPLFWSRGGVLNRKSNKKNPRPAGHSAEQSPGIHRAMSFYERSCLCWLALQRHNSMDARR